MGRTLSYQIRHTGSRLALLLALAGGLLTAAGAAPASAGTSTPAGVSQPAAPSFRPPNGSHHLCAGSCLNLTGGRQAVGQILDAQGHPGKFSCSGCTNSGYWLLVNAHRTVSKNPPFIGPSGNKLNKLYARFSLFQVEYVGPGHPNPPTGCVGVQARNVYQAAFERCGRFTYVVLYSVDGGATDTLISVMATNRHHDGNAYVLQSGSASGKPAHFFRRSVPRGNNGEPITAQAWSDCEDAIGSC